MIFNFLILLVALLLSGVSAYYSILGMTAIFAAAFWPIVIMGGGLEAGKIAAAVWLHKYWKKAPLLYKLYLVPSVVIMMIITSMGSFGFLSKAHIDQGIPSSDIASQVQLIDEKIKTQRDNIDVAKKALAQLDASVDQIMGRTDTERGVERAVQIRRQQAKERSKLQEEISVAQKEITKLQNERAPIASQYRKVEAEVGPIKYVAALIYGDNPNQDLLERAVRWVIISIICVFDPLAIVLILASSRGFEWHREEKNKIKDALPTIDVDNIQKVHAKELTEKDKIIADKEKELNELRKVHELEIQAAASIGAGSIPNLVELERKDKEIENLKLELQNKDADIKSIEDELQKLLDSDNSELKSLNEQISVLTKDKNDLMESLESVITERDHLSNNLSATHELSDKTLAEIQTLKTKIEEMEKELALLSQIDIPTKLEEEKFDLVKLGLMKAGFGIHFPKNPKLDQIFVRVDTKPSKIYRYTGTEWEEVDYQKFKAV